MHAGLLVDSFLMLSALGSLLVVFESRLDPETFDNELIG